MSGKETSDKRSLFAESSC